MVKKGGITGLFSNNVYFKNARIMAYSKKLNLLYIHIPKCAGTSVIEAIRTIDPSVDHGHKRWDAYDKKRIKIHHPKSFTIVRNPWDRVYSCYMYAIKDSSYWHGKNKIHGIHPDYELLKKCDFKSCVKMIHSNRELLNKPAEFRPNFKHNWDYQHPYVFDGHKKKVDQILRFEFMQDIVEWLADTYKLIIPTLNSSTNGNDYREHYDSEMIDLVGEVYKSDIELLEYKFE